MTGTTVVYWLFDHNCVCPRWHGYVGITNDLPKRIAQHREKGRRKAVEFEVLILFEGTKAECLALENQLRPDYGIGWNLVRGGWYPKDQRSPETRAKIAASHRGMKATAATRAKISATKSGQACASIVVEDGVEYFTQRLIRNAYKALERQNSNQRQFKVLERFKIVDLIDRRKTRRYSPDELEERRIRMLGNQRTLGMTFGPRSDVVRNRISVALRGKKHSVERCQKQSESRKGEKHPLFGKHHSEETKQRMSISAMRRGPTHGHSEEEKQRRRERWLGNTLTKGKPWSAARRLAWLYKQEK